VCRAVIATVKSCTLVGIDAELVDVECTIARGLPQYSVVGLAAPSVKEGATRIQRALKSVGYDLPLKKVTINLAPADLRKPGCGLDLPIALAVLVAEGVIDPRAIADLLVLVKTRPFRASHHTIDRLIKVARTIADPMSQDDIDAGCLLEAAAYRDVDPTTDLVPHVM